VHRARPVHALSGRRRATIEMCVVIWAHSQKFAWAERGYEYPLFLDFGPARDLVPRRRSALA